MIIISIMLILIIIVTIVSYRNNDDNNDNDNNNIHNNMPTNLRGVQLDSLRGSSVNTGPIQRRLAWSLRKDDTHTHTSRSVNKWQHLLPCFIHLSIYPSIYPLCVYIYIYIHMYTYTHMYISIHLRGVRAAGLHHHRPAIPARAARYTIL